MKKLNFTVFVFILFVSSCFIMAMGSFKSEKTISKTENRSLQEFPEFSTESYFSGEFFSDFESYIYDHIPFREEFLEIKTLYDDARGIEPELKALEMAEYPTKSELTSEDKFSKYKTQTENISILASKDRIMECFIFQESAISNYIDIINKFSIRVKDNVKVHVQMVPNYVGLTDREYEHCSDPQDNAIDYMYSHISRDVNKIDSFDNLYAHRDEYLYFKTDHHWTQRGSYYAAEEFLNSLGYLMMPLEYYSKTVFTDFSGQLLKNYSVTLRNDQLDYIECFAYKGKNPAINIFYYDNGNLKSYKNPLFNIKAMEEESSYGLFLSGDHPLVTYHSENIQEGKNLLLIKNSYGNAYIPWLTPYFKNISIIDPRHYKGDLYKYIESAQITDILVLDYIVATMNHDYTEKLNTLIEK